MKKIYTLFFLIFLFQGVQAQDQESRIPKTPIGGRPNIPSDLSVEFGFNQLTNRAEDLGVRFFRSRTFNVYYQYPINIFGDNSGFVLKPGIGIGTDKMAFQENKNLFNNPDLGPESSQLLELTEVFGDNIRIKNNTFAANYIDIPLDLVWHLNKSNYTSGFRASVGGKIGFLYNAHSKITFTDANGLQRKVKDSQNYGLEKIRYGISVKAGTPGFYAWGYFGLNQIWQTGLGPDNSRASQINFGIAAVLF
ncbi:porin family protein [Algoriphagus sediminis]|uniref:Porin family protein n=1 Tax=Algoriphagus sediminis TaxID=3057113 RepID=A0ABT7Y944_9BACT|nr:porin family protein [Algoriphagus sediminis]MDN3203020.1 porin family protein [Algoriphagus sediminis]